MKITRIAGEKCLNVRPLWEEVFSEDSKEFTDYYFTHKAADNIGYVMGEEPYEAMMFRTPYKMQLWDRQRELSYLVGVATRPEFRHRGCMTALLMTAFQDMYGEKHPFTYLMPANPAIYEPFDFRYVYERPVWQFRDRKFSPDALKSVTALSRKKEEVLTQLADFANRQLTKRYGIYVLRDAAYYKRQLEELKAQNGDIFIAYDENGNIQGFFLYAREEDEISIQELIEAKQGTFPYIMEEAEKKPIIMARIIHAQEMMRLARSEKPKTILLELKDDLIPENDGLYRWKLTPAGSIVTKLKDYRTPDLSIDIGELTEKLVKNVFINEIV